MPVLHVLLALAVSSLLSSCHDAEGAMQLVSFNISGNYDVHGLLTAVRDARFSMSTFNMDYRNWDPTNPPPLEMFTALENNDTATLNSAYERLEKQMLCNRYYSDWIVPLLSVSEDEFMNKSDHLTEFIRRCEIDSYTELVKQEISSKRDGIIQERREREERSWKAEAAQKRAEEEERKAWETQRRAEEEHRRAEEAGRRADEQRMKEAAERQRAEDRKRLAEERARQEDAKRRRRRRSGKFGIKIGSFSFSF